MPELPATATMVGFAKLCGVSRTAVYKWRARNLIAYTANGWVDVVATRARLDQYGGRKRSGGNSSRSGEVSSQLAASADPSSSWSTLEAIRHREIATARLKEIDADLAAAKVAPVEDSEREWAAAFAVVREGVLAASSRVAARLPSLSLADIAVIDDELRLVLAEVGGAAK